MGEGISYEVSFLIQKKELIILDDRMIPLSVLREYVPKLKDEDLKELGPVEYDQSKVPEVSKKHAENVRRKVYLPDMTESFARGVEYAGLIASEAVDISNETKGRQDTIESQFNAVQQEMTDKDVISAPEIISLRIDNEGKLHDTANERVSSDFNKLWGRINNHYQIENVSKMKIKKFKVGDIITTSGYYEAGDGGGATYKVIADTVDSKHYYETLTDGKYADLLDIGIHGYVDIRWLGAKADSHIIDDDGVAVALGTDVSPWLDIALNQIVLKNLGMKIKIVGQYYLEKPVVTDADIFLFGESGISRQLLWANNSNPEARTKYPSQIYVKEGITAFTLNGLGNRTDEIREGVFSFENICIRSSGQKSNSTLLEITTTGAPPQIGSTKGCEIWNLSDVLKFTNVTPGVGHMYYIMEITNSSIHHVKRTISGRLENGAIVSFGGLSIHDSVVERSSEGGDDEYHFDIGKLFGGNVINNTLLQSLKNPFRVQLSQASNLEITNSYFEGNTGKLSVSATRQMGEVYGNDDSNFRMHGNHIYPNMSLKYEFKNLNISELDRNIDPNYLDVRGSYVKDYAQYSKIPITNFFPESFNYSFPTGFSEQQIFKTEADFVASGTLAFIERTSPSTIPIVGYKGHICSAVAGSPFGDTQNIFQKVLPQGDVAVFCFYKTEGDLGINIVNSNGNASGLIGGMRKAGVYVLTYRNVGTQLPNIGLTYTKLESKRIWVSNLSINYIKADSTLNLGQVTGVPI